MGRRSEPRPRRHTVTRYQLPDGTRAKKGAPGARKVTTTTDTYYVELPRPGRRAERISLGTTDEAQAWRELERILDERAAGQRPSVRHASRPLSAHLDEFAAHLRAAGRTGEAQVALVMARLRMLADLAGWERLGQIDRQSATSALSRLTAERVSGVAAGETGRSARTRNHYLRHLKQFVTWCVEDGRLTRSPVAIVDPVDVESARRRVRRCPSDADVGRLMAYLEEEGTPRRRRMSGPHRALGYRVCMATGFRAKELRTLARESFDLDAGAVKVLAAHAKNRKEVTTPIPPWLVEELRAHFGAGGGVWQLSKRAPGDVLRLDLEACGVAYQTAEGFFDFHSLRVWYCTWAASRPDVTPKTLQTMARHSDPRLTLQVYAKAKGDEVRKVVDQLPRPGPAPSPASPVPPQGPPG